MYIDVEFPKLPHPQDTLQLVVKLGSLVLGGIHWTSKVSILSFWSIFGEG